MILILDNYDSFTYNLVHLVAQHTDDYRVERNDALTVDEVEALNPEKILLSPGPGRPEDAGIMVELIRRLGPKISMLGVCLGHQAIGLVYGGAVIHAPSLMHGKTSDIFHDSERIFADIPQGFTATRYHSLVVRRDDLPASLTITAETNDGVIMGLRHAEHPVQGIQFHPESILTVEGPKLVRNWLTS